PLKLQGEEAWIDPIHVEDAAAASLHAAHLLESEFVAGGVFVQYSVSSGHDVNATELVRLFEQIGGGQIPIQRGTGRPSDRKIVPWRGEMLPGWSPKIDLQQGIARIVAQRRR